MAFTGQISSYSRQSRVTILVKALIRPSTPESTNGQPFKNSTIKILSTKYYQNGKKIVTVLLYFI